MLRKKIYTPDVFSLYNSRLQHSRQLICFVAVTLEKLSDLKIYIKNMVCGRCKLIVRKELEKLGLLVRAIELGEVELAEPIDEEMKKHVSIRLNSFGFELISDKRSKTIEQVKNLIRELVHDKNNEIEMNLSDYLRQKTNSDYNTLSNLFSEVEGITIEKYFILQKIERVKELLMYDEMSLSEIAYALNYSSVAYLSNQFKKITGLTPSHFKNLKNNMRKHIDEL